MKGLKLLKTNPAMLYCGPAWCTTRWIGQPNNRDKQQLKQPDDAGNGSESSEDRQVMARTPYYLWKDPADRASYSINHFGIDTWYTGQFELSPALRCLVDEMFQRYRLQSFGWSWIAALPRLDFDQRERSHASKYPMVELGTSPLIRWDRGKEHYVDLQNKRIDFDRENFPYCITVTRPDMEKYDQYMTPEMIGHSLQFSQSLKTYLDRHPNQLLNLSHVRISTSINPFAPWDPDLGISGW